MTDAGHTPPDPPKPASAAEGCLSMLMFFGGAVLLLPAICTLMASGKSGLPPMDAGTIKILLVILALGLAGGWLIWLAVRPRKD